VSVRGYARWRCRASIPLDYNTSLVGRHSQSCTTGVGRGRRCAGRYVYANVENLIGSAYADSSSAMLGVNLLQGAAGNDTLTGGGAGADTLNGGSGL
jgi:Ca2+-binding RTX toxin-like protein